MKCSSFTSKEIPNDGHFHLKGDYTLCEHCWEPKSIAAIACTKVVEDGNPKWIVGRGEYLFGDIPAPEWCPLKEVVSC